MNYNHLNINERACIYQFKTLGMSIREIAKALDRSPSTISRELKRNSSKTSINYSVTKYSPVNTDKKYKEIRNNCHRPVKLTNEVKEYIESKIYINWSPEQIVNYNDSKPNNFPSISTIYRWIHLGILNKITMEKLRRKGNFKRPSETRGKFNIGKTIKKRPNEAIEEFLLNCCT